MTEYGPIRTLKQETFDEETQSIESKKSVKHFLFRLLIGGTAIITIIILGCYLSWWLVANTLCGNTILKTELSPNGNFKAVVYESSCGATTASTPNVSILRNDEQLSKGNGNVFVGEYGSGNIDIMWEDDTTLIVFFRLSTYPPKYQENEIYGIQIRYKSITEND